MNSGRPLRICVVGHSGDIHIRTRSRCFAERGHDVTVLTDQTSGVAGVTEIVPTIHWANIPKLRVLGELRGYREALDEARPDIVHVHYAHRIPAWMIGWIGPRPLVVSLMGGDLLFDERGDHSPRRRALTWHLLQRADLITVKSDHMLPRLGSLARKASRVSWGIDRAAFRRVDATVLRRDLGLAERDRVILSHRCLTPLYNTLAIVEAMPEVLRQCPEAVLLVSEASADTAYGAQVRVAVQRLGLAGRVHFVGEIPHERMVEYLSLAEVTVAVPSSDGLPQSLLEGLACGTPSLLGQLEAYQEVVRHGESAWLVALDSRSIAEGLIRLLGDADLRHRLIENGRVVVLREHDFPDQVSRVEALYRDLLAAPPPATRPSRLALIWCLMTGRCRG